MQINEEGEKYFSFTALAGGEDSEEKDMEFPEDLQRIVNNGVWC